VTVVRGDAAADIYNKGIGELQNNQYADAAKDFDVIINSYPTYQGIDDTRIRAGLSYLYATKYPEAIDRFSKEAADSAKPEFRSTALYFTALAQFQQGQKNNDKASFDQAATTLTTLINLITTAPTPENKGFLESAIYYRSLSYYLKEDYDNAEKDLIQLIQQFPSSLSLPDYNLRLGSVYAVETNQAVTAKKSADVVLAAANKALAVFDRVSSDPNALVQANEANMSKGEILFLVAQIDGSPDSYKKALDAYRLVRRKDDMIPLQQTRLDQLRKQAQQQASANAANGVKGYGDDSSLLITREENKLSALQDGPDPIIQALIRIAECYVSLQEPDEARTILHRLSAHAKLTTDQQQEVDFQTLLSYALGGQTEQADKVLTDYLSKHAGDPQADSISYLIAGELMKRKDYDGALKATQRSLTGFPKGRYAADVIGLEAEALTKLGKIDESAKIIDDFLKADPTNPKANNLLLTRAQNETAEKNYDAALKDYKQVADNAAAGPIVQGGAMAGYIQTLNSLGKFDDVITAAKDFQTKYPTSTVLPSVLLFQAIAMDQKHDPAAIAALQDLAKKYPKDDSAPFALSYVIHIYEVANNIPAMVQAANDLRAAYPESYGLLVTAADEVSTNLIKQKKFTDAIALYQPLADLTNKPDIAATATNKIGGLWLASAKSMGYYQSMQVPDRQEAEKRLSSGEQAYLTTLKKYPDQLTAVGDAFDGLTNAAKQRRSWGLLKDPDLEGYLTKLGADFTDPAMQARFEMAKTGLVFVIKAGATQFPAALDRYKKVIAANSSLILTRQESNQYGELLLAAKDYPTAEKVYSDLQTNAPSNDQAAQGDALYGLGATALGQGDLAKAKDFFKQLTGLNGGGRWHPHILDADYGIALADEQSTDVAVLDEARTLYSQLMQAQGNNSTAAKAMVGYGRLLEKAGYAVAAKPAPGGPNEFAIHYYQEPNLIYDGATPEQSAEGLYDAGQAYEKAGDPANAKKAYAQLLQLYTTTAPDWASKAQAAQGKLGP
jgi:tetratricopeptide (TPR) repeat protein